MELIPFRQSYVFSVLDLAVCIGLLKAIIMNNSPDTSATVLKILEKMFGHLGENYAIFMTLFF